MKIRVIGKAHLSGTSKRTGKPYDFIQAHYNGLARDVVGLAALTVNLDPARKTARKEWYYGIKLHAVVARKSGHLPIPISLMASGAAQHDLPAAKQIIEDHASLKPGKLSVCFSLALFLLLFLSPACPLCELPYVPT